MDRVSFLTDMITEAREGFDAHADEIRELTDAYLLKMDKKQHEWLEKRAKSNIYFPKLNAKAKRITDSLTETYFNSDKFAKLGEYINSDPKVIEKWQKAVDYYTEKIGMYKVFQPIFQKAPFLPLMAVKVYWSDEQCFIDDVLIENIHFDKRAQTSDDVRYIVNRVLMTKGDMLKLQADGIYKKKVSINELIRESKPYERFEVKDVYYRTPDGWELATIYGEATILRDKVKLKDGQPFVWGYMVAQVKEIDEENCNPCYGDSPLGAMLPLQAEYNTTRNQLIDAQKKHLSPKLILPKLAGISREDLEHPTKPLYMTNPTAIHELAQPNIQSSQLNLQISEQDASEATGVSPQQNGISTQRRETATMASIMANEGSVRLQSYVRTVNETFFEPIFQRLAMLVWRYGDSSLFMGIERSELPSYKISLDTGIGALNKEVQKRGLVESYQLIGQQIQVYMATQDAENTKRLVKANEKIIRELLPLMGIKDTDEFLGEEKNEFNTRPNIATGLDEQSPTQPQNQGGIRTGVIPQANDLGGQ